MWDLQPPRHISTLPNIVSLDRGEATLLLLSNPMTRECALTATRLAAARADAYIGAGLRRERNLNR